MENFKITHATLRESHTGYKLEANITIEVDAAYWKRLQKAGNLGQLYGIDVSNAVYALTNKLVPAWNPSVDHRSNARKGIKTVKLTYYFDDVRAGIALGLKHFVGKSGEVHFDYGASVNLLARRNHLKLVV